MDASSTLAEENHLVLDLVQALLGAISPNMRAVTLAAGANQVALTFYLARDCLEDREEAEDVAAKFEALQSGPLASLQVNFVVGSEVWPAGVASLAGRPIYVRRAM